MGSGWHRRPSKSVCQYNNVVTGTNDTLGLIANNYVEVNRPVNNQTGSPLARCGTGGALPAPQCDPSTATGSPTGSLGLTIDATVLGLNQSFVVNNYATSGNEGQLTVYGSIQQDARDRSAWSGAPATSSTTSGTRDSPCTVRRSI